MLNTLSTKQHWRSLQSAQFQGGQPKLDTNSVFSTKCEIWSQSLLLSELWHWIMAWRVFLTEHCDVTLKVTFDFLDINCHSVEFCHNRRMNSWVMAQKCVLWGHSPSWPRKFNHFILESKSNSPPSSSCDNVFPRMRQTGRRAESLMPPAAATSSTEACIKPHDLRDYKLHTSSSRIKSH